MIAEGYNRNGALKENKARSRVDLVWYRALKDSACASRAENIDMHVKKTGRAMKQKRSSSKRIGRILAVVLMFQIEQNSASGIRKGPSRI